MKSVCLGLMSKLGYHKVLFWLFFSFWYMSMTYQMVLKDNIVICWWHFSRKWVLTQTPVSKHKSRKTMKPFHSNVYFNNVPVSLTSVHKHLGMLLDGKLSYEHYLKFVFNKVKETIGLLRKSQKRLPWQSLFTIYKSLIQPQLDYGNTVYDRAFNESIHKKIESIQYNIAIT